MAIADSSFFTAHWLDITTTILGLAYIFLEYKASLWMWAVGFLMQALGIVLYYQIGFIPMAGFTMMGNVTLRF